MASNFDFLSKDFPVLAILANWQRNTPTVIQTLA